MQGEIEKRVDKYTVAKESGFTRNRFKVKNLSVINHWGDLGTIPETLTVNLSKNTAWSLGEEVELRTTEEDKTIMFAQKMSTSTKKMQSSIHHPSGRTSYNN